MIKKCPPTAGKISLIGKSVSGTIVKIHVVKPSVNRSFSGEKLQQPVNIQHSALSKQARKLPELPVLIPLNPDEESNSKSSAETPVLATSQQDNTGKRIIEIIIMNFIDKIRMNKK